MVLIKSIEDDFSTTHVIKWLEYFGIPFLRINEEKILDIKLEKGRDIEVWLEGGKKFNLAEIKSYWYRRGSWKFKAQPSSIKNLIQKALDQQDTINKKSLLQLLNEELKKRGDISDQESAYTANKLDQLRKAEDCGIAVPDYLVTTRKADLAAFLEKHPSLITKALNNAIFYITQKIFFPPLTLLVTAQYLERIPEHFAESIFQALVPKKYEIRSFYLNEKFHSMAIFSQSDDKTKVDFRNYNWEKPNRNVPFQLPATLEAQLQALMRKLELQSGSFDLIVTPDDQFVFLEVNPVGQFGMVSNPCNYRLEKTIAEQLAYGK